MTNGIHPLRTLCPDDPPETAEFLDYFDSTYISGRLRQQNPAQNQAVTKNCIFKVWTLKCRLLAWQFKQ
jgi:hypothetical protein